MPHDPPFPSLPSALFAARPHRHIVLVGPSGAGKSTVAPRLAQTLGFCVADLDALIEQRAGLTVAQIFAQRGEAGFRELEVATVQRLLSRRRPTVIAAGGGTWHHLPARALLQAGAQEVLLQITPQAAWGRLRHDGAAQSRPLLAGAAPLQAMERLAQARAASYGLCRVVVPVGEASVAEVVQRAAHALRAHVPQALQAEHEGKGYPIHFSDDGPGALVQVLAGRPRAQRVVLIGDATVLRLFAPGYVARLVQTGLTLSVEGVAPGEASKSFATVQRLLCALQRLGIRRSDVIVGLGGGVVLDLAAFVAGIYLRGITFVAVATTALAAVDASVGGKCGVNLGSAKNQVGLIRPPHAVVVDVPAVMAQPVSARAEGAVEALKMGALFAPELLAAVPHAGDDPGRWRALMAQAVALKIAVCRKDPQEAGLRAALNYGHTVGHALESGAGWAMGHGQAVALGMVAEAAFAERLQLARGVVAPLCAALRAMNMPVDWRRATVQSDALKRDKKSDGRTVVLPVVTSLGNVTMHTISLAQLMDFLRET